MKWLRWGLRLAAVVGIALWLWRYVGPREVMKAGMPAPDLIAELSEQKVYNLRKLRGKVSVINFWASYCGPCRQEAPELSKTYQKLRNRPVDFVGLAIDFVSADEAAVIGKKFGMYFPLGIAVSEDLKDFGIHAVPATIVVDKHGRIAWSRVGAVSERALTQAVEKALRL